MVTAIARSDESSTIDIHGTAFEQIDWFRGGVLGGVDACNSRVG
ncbi:MAG: hypothetical protein ABI658_28265 [Acidimicrobiales bacterium]